MNEHQEKAVEAAGEALEEKHPYTINNGAVDGLTLARTAILAADKDLQRMYFERFKEAVLAVDYREVNRRVSGKDAGRYDEARLKATLDIAEAALSKAQQLMEEGG